MLVQHQAAVRATQPKPGIPAFISPPRPQRNIKRFVVPSAVPLTASRQGRSPNVGPSAHGEGVEGGRCHSVPCRWPRCFGRLVSSVEKLLAFNAEAERLCCYESDGTILIHSGDCLASPSGTTCHTEARPPGQGSAEPRSRQPTAGIRQPRSHPRMHEADGKLQQAARPQATVVEASSQPRARPTALLPVTLR